MTEIIPIEKLQMLGTETHLFQGGEYGDIPISFFLVSASPGDGPKLHKHPYAEVFVVQEGQATITIGDSTIKVEEGHIAIGPANVPHKFINSGKGLLQMVNIHPSKEVIQQRLED
jgi:mannose-6-phosphate isomerase-like protein (cupin superfamily)